MSKNKVKHIEEEALDVFAHGDFKKAELLSLSAIKSKISSPTPFLILGSIRGMAHLHEEAATYFDAGLAIAPKNPYLLLNSAKSHQNLGNWPQAIGRYRALLSVQSVSVPAFNGLSKSLIENGEIDEAVQWAQLAIKHDPSSYEGWINLGLICSKRELYSEALEHYKMASKVCPERPESLHNISVTLIKLRQYFEAEKVLIQALQSDPASVDLKINLSICLSRTWRGHDAIQIIDEGLSQYGDSSELLTQKARLLLAAGNFHHSLSIVNQLGNSGRTQELDFLHAKILRSMGEYDLARKILQDPSNVSPCNPEILFEYATLLYENFNDADTALDSLFKATKLRGRFPEAFYLIGLIYFEKENFDRADHYLSIAHEQSADYALGDLIAAKIRRGDWVKLSQHTDELKALTLSKVRVAHPFHTLYLSDDPALHKLSAEIYTLDLFATSDRRVQRLSYTRRLERKVKLAYISPDFRNHAVSYLAAGLFEEHDRNAFEVYAFSLFKGTEDFYTTRIRDACDEFHSIGHLDDQSICELIRSKEIDIAIDLAGHTQGSRPLVWALRIAPIQINYLGYLGTYGSSCMDYLIADNFIVSKASEHYFSEKILYLPWYQVNDSRAVEFDLSYSRSSIGVDPQDFLYCCLNNTYKVNPEVFDTWCEILHSTPQSRLLIYAENDLVSNNYKDRARLRGIDAERIICIPRMSRERYFSCLRAADLFLDTWPYNAGTTASDALRVGLPIITLSGSSFPSRIAGSVLTAFGLPELICNDRRSYVQLATEFYASSEKRSALRHKLAKLAPNNPLFDTKLFTRNLEIALERCIAESVSA